MLPNLLYRVVQINKLFVAPLQPSLAPSGGSAADLIEKVVIFLVEYFYTFSLSGAEPFCCTYQVNFNCKFLMGKNH